MNTRPLLLSATLLGGVALGWSAGGGRDAGKAAAAESTAAPAPPPPGREERRAAPTGETWDSGKIIDAVRNAPHEGRGRSRILAEELAGWTDAELAAALQEALADPDTILQPEAAHALFTAYLQRDPEAATAWFLARTDQHQAAFAEALAMNWPADRAAEGLELYLARRSVFRRALIWPLLSRSLTEASTQGPEAMLALVRRFREEGVTLQPGGTFLHAPDFDFAAFFSSADVRQEDAAAFRMSMLSAWYRRDKEAAFAWVMEKDGSAALAHLKGGPGFDDQTRTMAHRWLGGKLETMAAAERATFLEGMTWSWLRTPDAADAILAGTKDAAVRMEILSHAMQGIYAGRCEKVLKYLGRTREGERAIAVLEAMEPAAAVRAGEIPRTFTPADEDMLRNALRNWGADEARAETIVRRMRAES